MGLCLNTRARLETLMTESSFSDISRLLPASLFVGVRLGDVSSVLGELKPCLSIAIHTPAPGATAEELLPAHGFEVKDSFCHYWRWLSPARVLAMPLLHQN